jgi:hypothetical protein
MVGRKGKKFKGLKFNGIKVCDWLASALGFSEARIEFAFGIGNLVPRLRRREESEAIKPNRRN